MQGMAFLAKDVVVFTLKTFLTSIQYLLFLTIQGKETNFRGHKLTKNTVQKNINRIKKIQRKSQHLRKNMIQVPKNHNKFRKTRSRLGQENPKKEAEPIAPTLKLSHKQKILYRSTNTSKTKLEEEAIPSPLRSRGVFIVGFPPTRPSPLNTLEL